MIKRKNTLELFWIFYDYEKDAAYALLVLRDKISVPAIVLFQYDSLNMVVCTSKQNIFKSISFVKIKSVDVIAQNSVRLLIYL